MSGKSVNSEDIAWGPHPNPAHKQVFLKSLVDSTTNPLATFNLIKVERGGEIVPHVHEASAETIYFTGGRGLGLLGQDTKEYQVGELVYVPLGTRHGFKNIGDEDMYLVTVFTPPL